MTFDLVEMIHKVEKGVVQITVGASLFEKLLSTRIGAIVKCINLGNSGPSR